MLQRGNYGVEWTERVPDEDSPVLARLVLLVVLVAVVSLGWTLIKRVRTAPTEVEKIELDATPPPPPVTVKPPEAEAPPPPPPPEVPRLGQRPPKVRNLLMRLEEAENAHDVEMAVTTIEALRAIPGSPVADLDDKLARRLGELNTRRLFELKSGQWVETVVAKRGDSASRIASEHGSTLASLKKLNGDWVENVRIGQQLSVLNHPRFNLIVHRRSLTADLQLNGKFFKRYDLTRSDSLKDGAFEWREVRLPVASTDRAELEMLLPRTTSVLISEM